MGRVIFFIGLLSLLEQRGGEERQLIYVQTLADFVENPRLDEAIGTAERIANGRLLGSASCSITYQGFWKLLRQCAFFARKSRQEYGILYVSLTPLRRTL